MTRYDIIIDTYIGYHPATKSAVREALEERPSAPVNVRINSYGGDVQHALDIRQQFIDHGNITVSIFGMTASAATILAMGAKRIRMSRYALMLVHRCSGWVDTWGQMNAEELAEAIERLTQRQADLSTIDCVMASLYAARTGRSAQEMAATMARAAWLTAEECLQLGLIDEIIEEGEPAQVSAALGEDFQACGLPLPAINPQPTNHTQSIQTNNIMNEETKNTPAAPEAAEAQESIVAELTAERDALSAQVNALTDERNALQEQVNQLSAQVEALQQADGAETDEIEDASEADDAPSASLAVEMYETLKTIL